MRAIAPWAIVFVAALSGLVVVRAELQQARPGSEKLQTPAAPARPSPPATPDSPAPRSPTRNLLSYGDAPVETPPPASPPTRTFGGIPIVGDDAGGAVQEVPPPRALLLGFIRRPASIQAVLELDGMVEVASAGASVRGWRVVLIDSAAETARVRSPEGEIFNLVMGVAPAPENPQAAALDATTGSVDDPPTAATDDDPSSVPDSAATNDHRP